MKVVTGVSFRNTNFRIKKRQVAAYFNNGRCAQTVWADSLESGLNDAKLVAAVNAGRDAFNAIWLHVAEDSVKGGAEVGSAERIPSGSSATNPEAPHAK